MRKKIAEYFFSEVDRHSSLSNICAKFKVFWCNSSSMELKKFRQNSHLATASTKQAKTSKPLLSFCTETPQIQKINSWLVLSITYNMWKKSSAVFFPKNSHYIIFVTIPNTKNKSFYLYCTRQVNSSNNIIHFARSTYVLHSNHSN